MSSHALENKSLNISFGKQLIGKTHKTFDLESDFKVSITSSLKIDVKFQQDSTQWIRKNDTLLIPRAKLEILIPSIKKDLTFSYQGKTLTGSYRENNIYLSLYISLFSKSPILIYSEGKIVSTIVVSPLFNNNNQNHVFIDYSCSRYKLKFETTTKDYISVGCQMHKTGEVGKEKPYLEVFWLSANYKLTDSNNEMNISSFEKTGKMKHLMYDSKNNISGEVSLSVQIPKRLHRFKSALGLGPYFLESTFASNKTTSLSPSLAFYFNFEFDQYNSFRGFNLFVQNLKSQSIFNNGGLYFANQIASIFDHRLVFTTMLGLQTMYYQFDKDTDSYFDYIAPQGIEVTWKHPFDNINHSMAFGIFVDYASSYDYINTWIRYNKFEVNYLYWEQDSNAARTYGLSYLIPFKSLF